ncbi:MAG: NAD(P)H-quinone oxidoreductase [Myxococcota bacterium]
MRVVVISAPGEADVLQIVERPTPEPPPFHVRVKVAAVGLNRADLLQRRGLYPAPAGTVPDVPGLEYTGVVDELGEGCTRFSAGDRVMGLVAGGAYSEAVVVHEREAMAVPSGLATIEAAAIPEAFMTAYDALRALEMRAGQRLLIHAIGSGVGTAALQIASWMGVHTVGSSRTATKLKRAQALGCDDVLLVDDPSAFAERIAPVDGVLDLVGGSYFEQSLASLKARGRLLVVGLTAGVSAPCPLAMILRKRLMVLGTQLRSRPIEEKIALARDFETHVLPAMGTALNPVVDRSVPMQDVSDAHREMESNQNFGKIVLTW